MTQTLDVLQAPSTTWADGPEDTRRRLDAVAKDVRELASAEGASIELLRILPELGPVFSGFASYLSTRADVVPAGLRADFARVFDRVMPAPAAEVRAAIENAWRRPIEAVCYGFEDRSIETRFPTQTHRAWLTPTSAIVVTVVPASFDARLEQELRLLPMLSPVLAGAVGGPDVFDRLVADFRVRTRRLLDVSADAVASEALVADARRFPPLRPRRPYPALSTGRVAVWDEIAAVPPDTRGYEPSEAGASAFRAWLRQALLGHAFPEEVQPSDFIIAGRRQVAVAGRLFTSLPTEAQATIQGYLVGVAAGDPHLAMRYMTRELVPKRGSDMAGFQRRIRHAWSVDADAAGGSELLAQLLLHWRIAVEHGFEPTPRLVSFYRGCLGAVSAAAAIGAVDDVLRDTLEALQLRLVANQIETLTGVSPTNARSVREAGWRFITALASGPLGSDRSGGAPGAPIGLIGSLLLVLAAIGFAAPALIASGVRAADQAGAAAFAAVGALLLFYIFFRRQAP